MSIIEIKNQETQKFFANNKNKKSFNAIEIKKLQTKI